MGKSAIQRELAEKHGITVSASTVGRVISRYGFFFADTPSHRQKRVNSDWGEAKPQQAFGRRGLALGEDSHPIDDIIDQSVQPGLGCSLILILSFATTILFGTFVPAVVRVHAAESSSYRLYGAADVMATPSSTQSSSFSLEGEGLTFTSKPLQSTSFQIVSAPRAGIVEETSPVEEEPTPTPTPTPTPSPTSSPPGGGGGGGGGAGGKIIAPPRVELPLVGGEGEEKKVPEGEKLHFAAVVPREVFRFFKAQSPVCAVCPVCSSPAGGKALSLVPAWGVELFGFGRIPTRVRLRSGLSLSWSEPSFFDVVDPLCPVCDVCLPTGALGAEEGLPTGGEAAVVGLGEPGGVEAPLKEDLPALTEVAELTADALIPSLARAAFRFIELVDTFRESAPGCRACGECPAGTVPRNEAKGLFSAFGNFLTGVATTVLDFFNVVDPVCPSCPDCVLYPSGGPLLESRAGGEAVAESGQGMPWYVSLLDPTKGVRAGLRGESVSTAAVVEGFLMGLLFMAAVGLTVGLTFRYGPRRLLRVVLPLRSERKRRTACLREFSERRRARTSLERQPWRGINRLLLVLILLAFAAIFFLVGTPAASAATTAPLRHTYNGHLFTSTGTAITSAHSIRFSYWTDANYIATDTNADGSINTSASTYVGWQEVRTVTPNSNGYFSVDLGSGAALPGMNQLSISTLLSLFLQVEVKAGSAADTAYEVLDPHPSDTSRDRSPVLSVPFALNADRLDQRDVGTSSGSIPVLSSGAQLLLSGSILRLDADDSEELTVSLQFGRSLGNALSYDKANSRFTFTDDLQIQGDLTVTGQINERPFMSLAPLSASGGGSLNLQVGSGAYRISGQVRHYTGGSITVRDQATNYVFFTATGGLTLTTSGFPTGQSIIPVAEVSASGGVITRVVERRITQADDRQKDVLLVYSAPHQNASYQGDATSNVGQLYVSHDNTNKRNYYLWTSTKDSLQDYDIILQAALPQDFIRFKQTTDENPLRVMYRTTGADSADNQLDISVFDTNGNPVTLSGASADLVNTSWTTSDIEFSGSPTWTAGQDFLIRFKVHARNAFQMHLSDVILEYVALPR
jgi:hypothetical protein